MSGEHRMLRIHDEIQEHLLQLMRVGHRLRQIRREFGASRKIWFVEPRRKTFPKYEKLPPAEPAKYPTRPFGKSKLMFTGDAGRILTSARTRMAIGGIPGMAPGHTAFGQSCFQAGAPSATSGVLINLSSL